VDDLAQLSPTSVLVLTSIGQGQIYGYSIMQRTGLPSGTIYPILSRLERAGLIVSRWQTRAPEEQDQRPPRKYYGLTSKGEALLAPEDVPQAASVQVGAGGE
jgi:PadR family transcriptional regulator, regulatory protein PadR